MTATRAGPTPSGPSPLPASARPADPFSSGAGSGSPTAQGRPLCSVMGHSIVEDTTPCNDLNQRAGASVPVTTRSKRPLEKPGRFSRRRSKKRGPRQKPEAPLSCLLCQLTFLAAALRTLVAAPFTWVRADLIWSAACLVYADLRTLDTSFSPRPASPTYALAKARRWVVAASAALPASFLAFSTASWPAPSGAYT